MFGRHGCEASPKDSASPLGKRYPLRLNLLSNLYETDLVSLLALGQFITNIPKHRSHNLGNAIASYSIHLIKIVFTLYSLLFTLYSLLFTYEQLTKELQVSNQMRFIFLLIEPRY